MIESLREHLDQISESIGVTHLFPQRPVVSFRAAQDRCARCPAAARLQVLKTSTRRVSTLHIGAFLARETVLKCPACEHVVHCPTLSRLVPASCNYGYDVMVHVGRRLFVDHHNTEEIRAELRARNIPISASEIGALGRKFVVYLAIAHQQSAARITETLQINGGYILHLDGTCDGNSPVLMTGLDGLTEIILGNVKLPSENADQIIPFLTQLKALFGQPIATVHDMGVGIQKAVTTVFGDQHDFICHYHFLRDLGRDLLGPDYDQIRKRLRKREITARLRYHARRLKRVIQQAPDHIEVFRRCLDHQDTTNQPVALIPTLTAYALIQWALDGKNQGRGYGFPFDRPHVVFTKRLYAIFAELQGIAEIYLRDQWRDNRPLFKLRAELEKIVADGSLRQAMAAIEDKSGVFDALRDAMRMAPETGTEGLNCDNMAISIQSIEANVTQFRQTLTASEAYARCPGYQKMVGQIDRYWEKLFADPISVMTAKGEVTVQPQRTNNIIERSFREFKRGWRCRTGNGSMNKVLQTMLADTPLVKNVQNPDYMTILLNGKESLEQVFADVDERLVRSTLKAAGENLETIPPRLHKIIRTRELPQMIRSLFRKP